MTEHFLPDQNVPYTLEEFARKWNIPEIRAKKILDQDGPSRLNCDATAARYKRSMKGRRGGFP